MIWNDGLVADQILAQPQSFEMRAYYTQALILVTVQQNVEFGCVLTSIINTTPMVTTVTYSLVGTDLIVPFSTFTQSPACGYSLTYSYLIDGSATIPSWLSFQTLQSQFQISSSSISDAGTYIIDVITSYLDGEFSFSDTSTVIVKIGKTCQESSWIPNLIPNLTTSELAIPSLIQSFSAFQVDVADCGVVTYSLSVSGTLNTITLDATALTITVAAQSGYVGSYSASLNVGLASYTTVTLSVPFTITVSSCVLTSVVKSVEMTPSYTYHIGTSATISISFSTFVQTPLCGYSMTYTYAVNSVQSAIYPWLTFSTTQFQLLANDRTFAGTYDINLYSQTTDGGQYTFSDTSSLSLTLVDPCPTAGWLTNSITNILTSVSVIPVFTQSFNSFNLNSPISCGSVSYALSPTLSFVTIDTTSFFITVTATSSSDVGTYSVNLIGTLDSYLSITPQSVPFTITINPCVLTSLGTSTISSTTPVPITIFNAAIQNTLATYIQEPSCNFIPSITLDADSVPATGIYSTFPFWYLVSGSTTVGEIYSNDYTLHNKQYTLRQQTQISSQTVQITKVVQFIDPCQTTAFISQTISDVFAFISDKMTPVIVDLPVLGDNISNTYVSSTSIPTCFSQSVAVTEAGQTVSFATLAGNTLTIATKDSSIRGSHNIDVTYTLDRYPTQQIVLSFITRLFKLISPTTLPSQTYQVGRTALSFSSGLFQFSPQASDMLLTYTITIASGSPLPKFITTVITTSSIEFTVSSKSNLDVGQYSLMIEATLSPIISNGQSISSNLQIPLTVTASISAINYPPQFTIAPTSSFTVKVAEPWSYTLPETIDTENEVVTVKAELGVMMTFMTFSGSTFNVPSGITTENMIKAYSIVVTLTDTSGGSSTSTITFNLVSAVTPTNSTATNESAANSTYASASTDSISSEQTSDSNSSSSSGGLAADAALDSSQPSPSSMQVLNRLKKLSYNGGASSQIFNWADKFAQAIVNSQFKLKGEIIQDPKPTIKKISNLGSLEIAFSELMVVPPLDQIQGVKVLINGKEVPALEIVIQPGFYTIPENLTFTYNITSYKPKLLTVQLTFSDPKIVSRFDDPDKVQVKFNGYYFFFSEQGRTVKEDTKLFKALPRMQDPDSLGIKLAELGSQISGATNVIIAGNIVLNIFLSASLQQLWSMINTQQIIVMMPLFSVNLPHNAGVFFGFIMQIAAFDILPTDSFYDTYFNIQETEPINSNFEQIGLGSLFFLYNVGSMIVVIASLPVLVVVILLMKPCRNFSGRINRYHDKLRRYMYWGHPITVFTESYAQLCICSIINIRYVSLFFFNFFQQNYETWGDKVSSVLAIFFFIVCAVVPVVFGIVLYVKFQVLRRPRVRIQLGALYSSLRLQGGRAVILQPLFFFARRIFLGLVVVMQNHLIVQILTMNVHFIIQLTILGFVQPFKEQFTKRMEYFNELVIMMTLYCMICFTDFVPSYTMQQNIGYACCLLVVSHLFFNLFFMLKSNVIQICLKIKSCRKNIKLAKMKKTAVATKSEVENQSNKKLNFPNKQTRQQIATVLESIKEEVKSESAKSDSQEQAVEIKREESPLPKKQRLYRNEKQQYNSQEWNECVPEGIFDQMDQELRMQKLNDTAKEILSDGDDLLSDREQTTQQFLNQSLNIRRKYGSQMIVGNTVEMTKIELSNQSIVEQAPRPKDQKSKQTHVSFSQLGELTLEETMKRKKKIQQ